MPRMSLRQYAVHRRCTISTVQYALAKGRIKKERDGKIDSVKADRDWEANTDAGHRRRHDQGGGVAGDAYMRARAVRETHLARLAEVELKSKLGELVAIEEVRQSAFSAARRVRDLLANMGDRLGPEVVGLSVEKAVQRINRECSRILDELSGAVSPGKNGTGRK